MSTVDPLLQWEIDWIRKHADRYDNAEHVIYCITQRYFLNKTQKLVAQFHKTKYTKDQIALFEHFGLEHAESQTNTKPLTR